jgi:YaaC-like Protein
MPAGDRFAYHESVTPTPFPQTGGTINLVAELYAGLPNCVRPLYIEGMSDFVLTLHCPTPAGPTPMNEPMAIYLAMFFLGSLVRYRPDVLDELLGTASAWLLESFVASAPLLFLRDLHAYGAQSAHNLQSLARPRFTAIHAASCTAFQGVGRDSKSLNRRR